jgi:hypothetical protein
MEEMSLQDAAAFVKHVRSCPACREELEEYYAFSSALMQLDALEEGEEKGNFFLNVEKRLERTELAAIRFKNDHWTRRILYIVMAIVLAAVMGVSMGV